MKFFCFYLALFFSISVFADETKYLLDTGDIIQIKVYGEDDLSLETKIGRSGKLNYPFLGEIKVSGLTEKSLQQKIYVGLKGDYLIEPTVYVNVIQYRPFFIHGEVRMPGSYAYQPGMTVNQAIAIAGGFTERASKEKIFLFKEKNKSRQIDATLDSIVHAGDTLTVEQRFF
ncbi:polysaccharide biosynthesis/export family protein [Pseudoalteromonas neustonica]|uniref:Polysaccharide biosynthesis/export family protein n=1 Tax=Pseudoalteromonas neustonica TaxID=1840331 RepID=A0ABU9U0D3_9GAMM|nr:polysaccharide biosynthesis/export family protein [Pseudoalteromonas sp. NEC-BIFX-2020_015]NMR23964.1 polysaccharide export protein [Pseudoalteromonas sp. NEC-BIFX-2020_015]